MGDGVGVDISHDNLGADSHHHHVTTRDEPSHELGIRHRPLSGFVFSLDPVYANC